jgi:amino acid transporter
MIWLSFAAAGLAILFTLFALATIAELADQVRDKDRVSRATLAIFMLLYVTVYILVVSALGESRR